MTDIRTVPRQPWVSRGLFVPARSGGAGRGDRNARLCSASDPILAGRLTLTGESVVLAGLITLAVGNQVVILHPHGHTPARVALLLFGAPLLYLLLQTGYLWAVTHTRSTARLIGVALLAVAAGAALVVPPFASLAIVAAVLVALVSAVLHENRALT